MRALRILSLCSVMMVAVVAIASADPKGKVSLNGKPIPHAISEIDATVEVTEFRDGSDPLNIKLIPGAKRYTVCIVSRSPIAVLDAELPLSDTPDRFGVKVEDGREFSSCLLTSLQVEKRQGKRPPEGKNIHSYDYCLRCENVTVPTR
jgi:hypothetical protein